MYFILINKLIINLVPPNVSLDNQLVGSPIGEKVTLNCRVEAYPSAITYWIRNRPNGKGKYYRLLIRLMLGLHKRAHHFNQFHNKVLNFKF